MCIRDRGIAVGMATNIPPHNLREVINGVVKIIDNYEIDKETEIEELLKIIKGPDFPTGAEILGTNGIEQAYRTGRGKIRAVSYTHLRKRMTPQNSFYSQKTPFKKTILFKRFYSVFRTSRCIYTRRSSFQGRYIFTIYFYNKYKYRFHN